MKNTISSDENFIVGAKRNPDGTMNYSKAVNWIQSNPEELAKQKILDFFQNRFSEITNEIKVSKLQNADNPVSRMQNYIEQAKIGNFFVATTYSYSYDGENRQEIAPSIYNYFKRFSEDTEQYIAAFGNGDAKKTKERMEKQKEALEIVNLLDMINSRNEEKIESNINFQQDVKSILESFDELDKLLDLKEVRIDSLGLATNLNKIFSSILMFKRVLRGVSSKEFNAINLKINGIQSKMSKVLDLCKVEKIKQENDMEGKNIQDLTFYWLGEEGPQIINQLQELNPN